MFPLGWPYPPEQTNGFWGVPTATIDWCEENYVVSDYFAEALNTTTNSVFFALAGMSIYNSWRHRLDLRWLWLSVGFLLVGIGLWWFHMTLRYEYQMLDELPMIYALCIPAWLVFSEFKLHSQLVKIGGLIFMAANFLTVIYMWVYTNPTLHQTLFGLLNAAIIYKLFLLTSQHVKDRKARQQLMFTMSLGVGLFVFGYILWNLDIHLCPTWRHLRREIGMPYGFLLEGHGWWHVFTGLGVYFYLVYEMYLRLLLQGTAQYYLFHYTWGLPFVTLVDKPGLDNWENVRKLARADADFKKNQ